VLNSGRARRLLAAGQQDERGSRMVAFFGCLYPKKRWASAGTSLASLPDRGWAN
jgi:hypothetical protein